MDNITNEVSAQDSNDKNKTKENENICPQSFKLKEKYISIETIYNAQFELGTYKRIIPGGINSLETMHLEWRRNNNS